MPIKDLSKLVREMDSMNMGFMVNLSGFRGIYLEKSLKNYEILFIKIHISMHINISI